MVIALIALATTKKPTVARGFDTEGREISNGAYAAHVIVERCEAKVEKGLGDPGGLAVRGHIKNNGPAAVVAADLRCFFPTRSGGESCIDFPLIADTRLEGLRESPLMASSGRDFALRIGRFPDDLLPDMLRAEVVNIKLKSR